MASKGSGLTSLPTELILRILDYSDPASQVSLACAARYLADCCHRQFRRHQAAHAKYGVSSDLDPSTVPHLLRSVLGHADPLDAWHVRSFELWGARESWDEWRPFDLEAKTTSGLQDREPLRWSFLEGEVERLLGVFGEEMEDGLRRFAEEGLRAGGDWFLKAVLIALLPRLVDVKVVAGAGNKALTWLTRAMSWSCKSSPPRFASVRSVAVGVSSGTWRDESREALYAWSLVSILYLPQLQTLYFSGLDTEAGIDNPEGYQPLTSDSFAGEYIRSRIPPASIPLQQLTLDNMGEVSSDFREALLAAPRALEALSLRAGEELRDTDSWASGAGDYQGHSLRRLMLYNAENMRGYRCSAYYPEVLTDGFSDLRQACVAVSDVELQAMKRDFCETFREAFPEEMEVLVLYEETGVFVKGQEFPTQFLDETLAEVIRDREECYPKLKAVFLEQVEDRAFQDAPGKRVCFQKAIEAGREESVDVFTRTNGRRREYEVEFLAPLGRYDLLTGPYGRKGREGMVLDLGTGEWVQDCGCCGKCESCLRVYTAEVWDALLEERQEGEEVEAPS